MPPSRGMECTPVFSGDDAFAPNGEIQLEVSHTGGNSNRSGGYEGAENDYAYDESTDQYHFVGVSDEQMAVDPQSSGFDEETYLHQMIEAEPIITEAIQWGTENLPAEMIDEYNAIVDNTDDLDELHNAVNWIVDTYNASMAEAQSQYEVEAYEQDQPVTQEEVDSVDMDAEAELAYGQGDEILGDLWSYLGYAENGQMSTEEVNEILLSKYSLEDLQEALERA